MREFLSHQKSYLKDIRAYIARMPSLSTTATKALETCNNPRSSPNDLNRVIGLDPVLAGQVLRLTNSAYYSLGHPVSSLTRAIIMLGINTVKNLVLSFAILEQLRNKNIVVSRKEANRIYYRIRNPQLLELIGTMRQVLCPANLDDRPPQG